MSNPSTWSSWLKTVDQLRKDTKIPGVAVSMIEGTQVQSEGLGVRHTKRGWPVTTDTLFHIASTQKSMTSMFIATLVDEGLFDWDTPVSKITSKFRLRDKEATRTVTMRHLLGMSSGIPASSEDNFDIEKESAEDLFSHVQRIKLHGKPGSRFDYSNVSYSLAGYVGVLAAGGSWGRLEEEYGQCIQDRILKPCGMTNATVLYSKARSSEDFSRSYELYRNKIVEAEPEDSDLDPLAPSGSVKASVTEMSMYLIAQMQEGISPQGNRLVSAENLKETWKPHIAEPDDDTDYAMGWVVEKKHNKTILHHEGSYDGFTSFLAMIPEDQKGFVLLTNMEDDDNDFLPGSYDEWLSHILY